MDTNGVFWSILISTLILYKIYKVVYANRKKVNKVVVESAKSSLRLTKALLIIIGIILAIILIFLVIGWGINCIASLPVGALLVIIIVILISKE